MRSDYSLMNKMIAGFSAPGPTADGASADRVLERLASERPVDLPEAPAPGLSLRETFDRRSSSLSYGTDGLFLTDQLTALRQALRQDRDDWGEAAASVPLEGFVFALRSIDLAPGIYRVDADGAARVGELPAPEHWDELGVQKEFAAAGAIVSVAVDLDRADSWAGTHGYRVAMARAAGAIYDLHLSSVAHGLVGTVFAGFIPASVRHVLHSDGASRHQMFAMTVAPPPAREASWAQPPRPVASALKEPVGAARS